MANEVKEKQSLTDRIINIYTGGGGGGGASSWILPVALVAGLGIGGYFLYKKLFGGAGKSTWILMQTFVGIPVTEPTGAVAFWIPLQTLGSVPVTTPTTSVAVWIPLHIVTSVPATTPTSAVAVWLMMHTVTSVPAITATGVSALWLLMQTVSGIPATTPATVSAIWILMHTLASVPAVTPAPVSTVWILQHTLANLPATTPAATPGITNVQITNYPTSLQLNSPCTITVSFTYVGAAGSKALHAAIGQQGAFGFDEKSAINTTVYAPAATSPTNVTATVTIPTTGLPAGLYGLTAKVEGVESGVLNNVVTIIGSSTPVISNVRITSWPTSAISPGAPCPITVAFDYVGPATTKALHAALGIQGAISFDEISGCTVDLNVSILAANTVETQYVNAVIPTKAGLSGLYDIYAKLGGVISPIYQDVINIGATVTLTTYADPSNAGFVEVIPSGNIYPIGTSVTLRAWVYNSNYYRFAGWYTAGGNLRSTLNPITIQMNADVTYIARFTAITPPPVSGPTFPAPGVVGDGQYWYWIVFVDDSAGWFDALAYYEISMYDPSAIKTYYGPYPSGATS